MKKLILLLFLISILGCSSNKKIIREQRATSREYRASMMQAIRIYQFSYGMSYKQDSIILGK
jgi:hypothetical protein